MLGSMLSLAAVFLYGTNGPNSAPAGRWERVPIGNADFCSGSGQLQRSPGKNLPLVQPAAIDHELGDAVWHGHTDAVAGTDPRTVPQIEVNFSLRKAAFFCWHPATAPAERASACLWNHLPGTQLRSRRNYLMMVEVDAGRQLTVEEWRRRGFSIALHTGATEHDRGVAFVDSLTEGAYVQVENLKGTAQRLHLLFATDHQPPAGNLSVVITAAPAKSAPAAPAVNRYLLRSVALLVSMEGEGFAASLDGSGRGGNAGGGSGSMAMLPFMSSETMVPISSPAEAQTIPVVPEPTTLALLVGALPLALLRRRTWI